MLNVENVTALYIENNIKIRKKYTFLMAENGYRVLEAENFDAAHDLLAANKVDFILMDIILPNENGLDFIRALRHKEVSIPIIITTSVANQTILLDAINLDISRYLIKPFCDSEILDALHLVTKRLFTNHPVNFSYLQDGYYYDPINKSLINLDGKNMVLSKKEYRLMELLLSNREKTIPYSAIEMAVWQGAYMSMDALRTLVLGIRKKTYPNIILNHSGVGYKINI